MNRTPWFPGEIKPARRGVYERLYAGSCVFFCKWTGYRWLLPSTGVNTANAKAYSSGYQNQPWRGLTEKAK